MRHLVGIILIAMLMSGLPWSAGAETRECRLLERIVVKKKVTLVCTVWGPPAGGSPLKPQPKPNEPVLPGQPAAPGPPGQPIGCLTPFDNPTACIPTDAGGNPIDIPGAARTAALSLRLPAPTVKIGPDPAGNKWNMIPIGFPLWIWTTEPKTMHATTTQQGIAITMSATQGPTTITFGDGTTIVCQTMTPRAPVITPPPPSPDCGHTYRDKGDYVIGATTTWNVNWQALGLTGTIPITRTGSAPLRVGELTAVLVQGP